MAHLAKNGQWAIVGGYPWLAVWMVFGDESETSRRRVHNIYVVYRTEAVGRGPCPDLSWREGLFAAVTGPAGPVTMLSLTASVGAGGVYPGRVHPVQAQASTCPVPVLASGLRPPAYLT